MYVSTELHGLTESTEREKPQVFKCFLSRKSVILHIYFFLNKHTITTTVFLINWFNIINP